MSKISYVEFGNDGVGTLAAVIFIVAAATFFVVVSILSRLD